MLMSYLLHKYLFEVVDRIRNDTGKQIREIVVFF